MAALLLLLLHPLNGISCSYSPPCFRFVINKGGNNYKKSEKYPKIAYFLARLRRAFLIISLIFELFDHFEATFLSFWARLA